MRWHGWPAPSVSTIASGSGVTRILQAPQSTTLGADSVRIFASGGLAGPIASSGEFAAAATDPSAAIGSRLTRSVQALIDVSCNSTRWPPTTRSPGRTEAVPVLDASFAGTSVSIPPTGRAPTGDAFCFHIFDLGSGKGITWAPWAGKAGNSNLHHCCLLHSMCLNRDLI